MNYKLISDNGNNESILEHILKNRGVLNPNEYINVSKDNLNSETLLGLEALNNASVALSKCIINEQNCCLIVDSDADGFTSAAIIYNYLYRLFPSWVTNHLHWFIHDGKEHGLKDSYPWILSKPNVSLVICPDSATNDIEEHSLLKSKGIECIVLDHHIQEAKSQDAIIINNQCSDFPNKDFSGAGITWEFCRFLDKILNKNIANDFLDLVALGNQSDMMSILAAETKFLINEGFKEENIKNPFIIAMGDKQRFSLNKPEYKSYNNLYCTPMGASFFITPFINAIVRSGTMEEKELVFKAFLEKDAHSLIPSTKKGHALNAVEKLVDQALRVCTNVKNRQTKSQNLGIEMLERKIEKDNLLDHQVLLFLLDPGELDKNIAGLCASKFSNKYQRPCCILTKNTVIDTDVPPWEPIDIDEESVFYSGSARGYDANGVNNFKDICEETGCVDFTAGHESAFGISIYKNKIDDFIEKTDKALCDIPKEPIYMLDYLFYKDIDESTILEIGKMNDLYGKDFDRPLVGLENIKVCVENSDIYEKKTNTLKIKHSSGIDIMIFDVPTDICDKIKTYSNGYISMNIMGKALLNEWNGKITPQIVAIDYEIIEEVPWEF